MIRALRGTPGVALALFAATFVVMFRSRAETHESIYLLGSRRVHDPSFLAADFTWSSLPPTTWLFDHLVAPLWSVLDEFSIVMLGRLLVWGLVAWSLAWLARLLRLPGWTVVVGYTVWLLWGQTFAQCGLPIEGFQVKSLSYPLLFFALGLAMRQRLVLGGLAAGLATALHIVVGGWGLAGLTVALAVNRRFYTWRQLASFIAAAALFVLPTVGAVALFHTGEASAAERRAMDEIYVTFAAPHCCDPAYYMSRPERWLIGPGVLIGAPLLTLRWNRGRRGRLLAAFLAALGLFFAVGLAARPVEAWGLLKLFPGQLAKSLPVLFTFVLFLAHAASGRLVRRFGRATIAVLAIVLVVALDVENISDDVPEAATEFVERIGRPNWGEPRPNYEVYGWITKHTPRDAVFITPFFRDFWPYAERGQVASMRHPPLDLRLIEWKERLVALNGGQPFQQVGFDINDTMSDRESKLSATQLVDLRVRFGATHYVTARQRPELDAWLLYADDVWYVYDVVGLEADAARRR
jgi:hypothetical protein